MKKRRKFIKSKIIDKLWEAISLLKGPKEIRQFLEDILYPSEVSMLGQRLLIATLFRRGLTYEQVVAKTGAGKGTAYRVGEVFHRGTGGYELALSRLRQKALKAEYDRREYAKTPEARYLAARLRKGK
jgi:TrpR-related protein YerC/YecD